MRVLAFAGVGSYWQVLQGIGNGRWHLFRGAVVVADGYVVDLPVNLHGLPFCDFLSTDFASDVVAAIHLEGALLLTFLYRRTCGTERALSTHVIVLTATGWIWTAHVSPSGNRIDARSRFRRSSLLNQVPVRLRQFQRSVFGKNG
jgi:hypothetical protein